MGDRSRNITIDGVRPIRDLKVVELKAELERRGLSKSGSKKELCERLRSFVQFENTKTKASSVPTSEEEVPNRWLQNEAYLDNDFIREYFQSQQALYSEQIKARRSLLEADTAGEQSSGNRTQKGPESSPGLKVARVSTEQLQVTPVSDVAETGVVGSPGPTLKRPSRSCARAARARSRASLEEEADDEDTELAATEERKSTSSHRNRLKCRISQPQVHESNPEGIHLSREEESPNVTQTNRIPAIKIKIPDPVPNFTSSTSRVSVDRPKKTNIKPSRRGRFVSGVQALKQQCIPTVSQASASPQNSEVSSSIEEVPGDVTQYGLHLSQVTDKENETHKSLSVDRNSNRSSNDVSSDSDATLSAFDCCPVSSNPSLGIAQSSFSKKCLEVSRSFDSILTKVPTKKVFSRGKTLSLDKQSYVPASTGGVLDRRQTRQSKSRQSQSDCKVQNIFSSTAESLQKPISLSLRDGKIVSPVSPDISQEAVPKRHKAQCFDLKTFHPVSGDSHLKITVSTKGKPHVEKRKQLCVDQTSPGETKFKAKDKITIKRQQLGRRRRRKELSKTSRKSQKYVCRSDADVTSCVKICEPQITSSKNDSESLVSQSELLEGEAAEGLNQRRLSLRTYVRKEQCKIDSTSADIKKTAEVPVDSQGSEVSSTSQLCPASLKSEDTCALNSDEEALEEKESLIQKECHSAPIKEKQLILEDATDQVKLRPRLSVELSKRRENESTLKATSSQGPTSSKLPTVGSPSPSTKTASTERLNSVQDAQKVITEKSSVLSNVEKKVQISDTPILENSTQSADVVESSFALKKKCQSLDINPPSSHGVQSLTEPLAAFQLQIPSVSSRDSGTDSSLDRLREGKGIDDKLFDDDDDDASDLDKIQKIVKRVTESITEQLDTKSCKKQNNNSTLSRGKDVVPSPLKKTECQINRDRKESYGLPAREGSLASLPFATDDKHSGHDLETLTDLPAANDHVHKTAHDLAKGPSHSRPGIQKNNSELSEEKLPIADLVKSADTSKAVPQKKAAAQIKGSAKPDDKPSTNEQQNLSSETSVALPRTSRHKTCRNLFLGSSELSKVARSNVQEVLKQTLEATGFLQFERSKCFDDQSSRICGETSSSLIGQQTSPIVPRKTDKNAAVSDKEQINVTKTDYSIKSILFEKTRPVSESDHVCEPQHTVPTKWTDEAQTNHTGQERRDETSRSTAEMQLHHIELVEQTAVGTSAVDRPVTQVSSPSEKKVENPCTQSENNIEGYEEPDESKNHTEKDSGDSGNSHGENLHEAGKPLEETLSDLGKTSEASVTADLLQEVVSPNKKTDQAKGVNRVDKNKEAEHNESRFRKLEFHSCNKKSEDTDSDETDKSVREFDIFDKKNIKGAPAKCNKSEKTEFEKCDQKVEKNKQYDRSDGIWEVSEFNASNKKSEQTEISNNSERIENLEFEEQCGNINKPGSSKNLHSSEKDNKYLRRSAKTKKEKDALEDEAAEESVETTEQIRKKSKNKNLT